MASTQQRPEVVVVTGAGAGLGRAIVLPGDVADPETTERAAARTEEAFGPIDVWVNDAMTTVFSEFHEMTPEDFRRATEVTYLGFVYGTMAALKRMRARDHGMIVQVGSALAYRSIPLQSAYCGAKHAIVGFTDSLRSELIHNQSHVHVTVVHMPALNTPQFTWCKSTMPRKPQPVPPIFQPEVGARAVYWAAHQHHREVFVGWSTARAIWANRLMPGVLDHVAARMGWDGQMYDGSRDPDQQVDLYEPVPGHQGAHGAFDDRARTQSWEMELTMRLSWLGTGAATFANWALNKLMGPQQGSSQAQLGTAQASQAGEGAGSEATNGHRRRLRTSTPS
jgi:short-subunit dehydrogenase